MGITTKDLAQLCGVSRTTVHRALSGVGRINPDTKELILRTAKEHDYRPDLLARGLVKGRTYNIGIVVLDVENRYFAEMLGVIGAEMNRRGYCMNIMLHGDDRELEQKQLMRLAAYHVDGLIVSSVNEGEEYREFLTGLGVPVVSVDNRIADGIPFVGIDQRAAMREVTGRVLEREYERVVYVCPPLAAKGIRNVSVHEERLVGFYEACGACPQIQTVCLNDWSYLEHVKEQLADGKRTAFLCTADSFALEIMKRLRADGLEAPRDYGITGFDNIDTLEYVSPRLMTVSNSVGAVATAAVGLLFRLMESENTVEDSVILPHEIVAGETI